MIDQRASDGHTLLLAAGKLREEMLDAIAEADALERLPRFGFVRGAVEVLGEHYVFHSGEIRHQVELLKHESDFLGAETREAAFIEMCHVSAVHNRRASGGRIEAAQNIDECG